MSGLLLTTGTFEELERMAAAAPHRGELQTLVAGNTHLGVMRRSWGTRSGATGLAVDGGVTVISVGSIYAGTHVISGDQAATHLLGLHRQDRSLLGLSGTCTFVLVDETGDVLAVRDAIGRRPLYASAFHGCLRIASEIKQLLAVSANLSVLDLHGVRDAATFQASDATRTPYAHVERVGGGMVLRRHHGRVTMRRWWRPPERRPGDVLEASRALHAALVRAVTREADTPHGVLLSGGLDSSAVAAAAVAAARRANRQPPRAISALYPKHPATDETRYINATVRHLDMPLHTVEPAPRPFRSLEEEVRRHDGPSVGWFASNFRALLDEAKGRDCLVLLDGHDGDSLLGRTSRVVPAMLRRHALGAAWQYVSKRRTRTGSSWARLLVRQALELVPPAVEEGLRQWRAALRGDLARAPTWVRFDVGALAYLFAGAPVHSWDTEQRELTAGGAWQVLEHLEREALTAGVELIHPLFDQDVIELVLGLPPEVVVANGEPKGLLRHAFRDDLPEMVTHRRTKSSFAGLFVSSCPASDVRDALRRIPLDNWIDSAELEATLTRGAPLPELLLLATLLKTACAIERLP